MTAALLLALLTACGSDGGDPMPERTLRPAGPEQPGPSPTDGLRMIEAPL